MKQPAIVIFLFWLPVFLFAQVDPITKAIPQPAVSNISHADAVSIPHGSRSTCSTGPCLGSNLVPNPGFETITSCPTGFGQLNLAQLWTPANQGTPEVYNVCATASGAGVPDNLLGHRPARSGNGFAGIGTYTTDIANFREYISAQLLSPMQVGATYHVEFWVSNPNNAVQYASNNLGAYFSVNALSSSSSGPFAVIPQVNNTTVIFDTVNWVQVCDEFTATSAFDYITIGNFFDDANTTAVFANGHALYHDAYYFVDDVLVTQVNNNSISVNLGNDTSICSASSLILNAITAGATYHWQDGSASPTYTVSQSGTYSVTVSVSGCASSDSINISLGPLPPVTITASDTLICASNTAQICAPAGTLNYLWNTGATTNCIFTSLAGNYYVTVSDNGGCSVESNHLSIAVRPVPSVSISVNGDTLSVYNAFSCQWYLNGSALTGATDPIYIVHQQGSYTVQVVDTNGCSAVSNPINFTGLENLEPNEISIYPNPATDQLFIETGKVTIIEIIIYNATGEVLSKTKRSENNAMDLSQFSAGVYIIEVKTKEGVTKQRFVKL